MKLLISPLAGEMSGRAEGSVKDRQPLRFAAPHQRESLVTILLDRLEGQHPPLSYRTSLPQGGRLAVTSAFASLQCG
ncbi:hypothetical protein EH240_12010 [Mesorhizobium tamadayense]|uniref:Uncharacterized protein n=1 Tax=Mesorhizobium tamadayense TaxID=425306 RepID=A0A3P3FVR4_9HYPH|nr:hypothetical protein EH240_12010 [Mesorhizobium tamadayense]